MVVSSCARFGYRLTSQLKIKGAKSGGRQRSGEITVSARSRNLDLSRSRSRSSSTFSTVTPDSPVCCSQALLWTPSRLKCLKGGPCAGCSLRNMASEASTHNDDELDSFLSRSFLDLEKIDQNLFRSKSLWQSDFARSIYGGQIIGHCLVAASQSIPKGQQIHSLHAYFLKPGRSDVPILYHVDNTRDGRSYCSRSVKATQDGHALTTMQASFKLEESSPTNFQLQMPDVPPPEDVQTHEEVFDLLRENDVISEKQSKFGRDWYGSFPIMMKWVDPADFMYLEPRQPKRCLWMKAKGHIGADMDQNTHKCCIGYMSDLFLLQTSFQQVAPLKFSEVVAASLDHSMWFHAPCRADEWLLFEIQTEHTGGGRSLCHGRIWNRSGDLVISVAQEGVLRTKTPSKL